MVRTELIRGEAARRFNHGQAFISSVGVEGLH
jgi:hypothetical protein